ncbi:hypothetical protein OF83DRAFT_1162377 [Amylostereum chailletii]|nr:hypothetical protein OF83DRAFT_1162377 [Amylostereum chailletii]
MTEGRGSGCAAKRTERGNATMPPLSAYVTNGIWTFSRPFTRVGFLYIGGRSTAIKLSDGGVWVLASTPLDEPTKKTIDNMGPVKYIIAADRVHYLYVAQFHKAYPEAKVLGVEPLLAKEEQLGLKFSNCNPGAPHPDLFCTQFLTCTYSYFSGFHNKDVAFLHKPSRTLIQADLLFNFPATEQYSQSAWPFNRGLAFLGLFGAITPFSSLHQKMAINMGRDKIAMRRDAKTVAEWDFDRIIPCHGDVIEKDGNKAWRAAYKAYLE